MRFAGDAFTARAPAPNTQMVNLTEITLLVPDDFYGGIDLSQFAVGM